MTHEELMSSPSKYFKTPGELVSDHTLGRAEKIIALENWKQSCSFTPDFNREGLSSPSNTEFQEVSDALKVLKKT